MTKKGLIDEFLESLILNKDTEITLNIHSVRSGMIRKGYNNFITYKKQQKRYIRRINNENQN